MSRFIWAFVLLGSLTLPAGLVAWAGPYDARVGQVRATYRRDGTVLRAEPTSLATAVATLRKNAQVRVVEVKHPWVRVSADVPSQGTVTGWVRSALVVEPSALNANPTPVKPTSGATGGVSHRDVSAAGRQLTAKTERMYRTQRTDLNHAYAIVDQMEAATRSIDPSDSIGFIVGAALGRPGQDYSRPGLLPPDPPRQVASRQQRRPRVSEGARRVGGLLERFGGRAGRDAARAGRDAARVVEKVSPYFDILRDWQQQLAKSFTPEQEYYLGRAVAANAIAQYGVDPNARRRAYVRHVGDAIVRLSCRLSPNYGGYHFEVLDSDEINGISGPGGFVLVTRGAVTACRTEDELASVLCHELGHIRYKDGEMTLRKGRNFQATLQGVSRGVTQATGLDQSAIDGRLLEFFTRAVGDMSRTSAEHSYGKAAEFRADTEGTYLLYEVLYDHAALRDYLQMLAARPGVAYRQAATHAPPQLRASHQDQQMARLPAFPGSERVKEVRRDRLNQALNRQPSSPR